MATSGLVSSLVLASALLAGSAAGPVATPAAVDTTSAVSAADTPAADPAPTPSSDDVQESGDAGAGLSFFFVAVAIGAAGVLAIGFIVVLRRGMKRN